MLENLPQAAAVHTRYKCKTTPAAPPLGPRESKKPADWPRGSQSKGIVMDSTKRKLEAKEAEEKRKAEEQGGVHKKPARKT